MLSSRSACKSSSSTSRRVEAAAMRETLCADQLRTLRDGVALHVVALPRMGCRYLVKSHRPFRLRGGNLNAVSVLITRLAL